MSPVKNFHRLRPENDPILEHDFDHPFERGMRNRRAALGDARVDKSVAKANTFNAEFQHFITDYAWHGVWDARTGLENTPHHRAGRDERPGPLGRVRNSPARRLTLATPTH